MEVKGEKLEIGYGGRIIVPEMDITVRSGEITTIIGPNGSGKSTVMKALTRLLRYTKGAVYIGGRELAQVDGKTLARSLGVLPQRHSAPPDFKCATSSATARAVPKMVSAKQPRRRRNHQLGAEGNRCVGFAR